MLYAWYRPVETNFLKRNDLFYSTFNKGRIGLSYVNYSKISKINFLSTYLHDEIAIFNQFYKAYRKTTFRT